MHVRVISIYTLDNKPGNLDFAEVQSVLSDRLRNQWESLICLCELQFDSGCDRSKGSLESGGEKNSLAQNASKLVNLQTHFG